jgi:hypothetical protein
MSRKPKMLPTRRLKYSGNEKIERYLEDLVKTGFFGRSAEEAAERLISQGIDRAIRDGTIKSRPDEAPE